jgi:hypothetical protein
VAFLRLIINNKEGVLFKTRSSNGSSGGITQIGDPKNRKFTQIGEVQKT